MGEPKDVIILLKRFQEDLGKIDADLRQRSRQWNVPFPTYDFVFRVAIVAFKEAILCFTCQTYEACAIMCRNAVDSALYAGSVKIRAKDLAYLTERPDSALVRDKDWNWRELRKTASKYGLLSEEELAELNSSVREEGNFAAHIAIGQDKKVRLEAKKTKPGEGIRIWVGEEQAFKVLEATGNILLKIIKNYFDTEKTLV